jgi:hypothetical protein
LLIGIEQRADIPIDPRDGVVGQEDIRAAPDAIRDRSGEIRDVRLSLNDVARGSRDASTRAALAIGVSGWDEEQPDVT